uniref:Uncharacterized protein n=1 Tax=Glossina brevipalpis TaxID=37001 RepID=A0A1A9W4Z5_9MUSC
MKANLPTHDSSKKVKTNATKSIHTFSYKLEETRIHDNSFSQSNDCLTVQIDEISLHRARAIFEQGTDEVQSAFKYAMLNHNLNVSSRRFELQAYVDVINTADAFKLSRLSR